MIRTLKKSVAILMVLLQGVQPAMAADDLAASLKSLLFKSVSERLASGFDVANGDAKAERSMTVDMQKQARHASDLFAAAGQPGVEFYDPSDLVRAKVQLERWKTFGAKTRNKKTLTEAEIQEAAGALLPFFRYYSQGDAKKPDFVGNNVVVPAGKTVQIDLQGYCMDRAAPAPHGGEKLQLVSIERLLPPEAILLYQAMMQYSAEHIDKRSEIQNLVWGLRHAADPYPPIRELSPGQVALLDAAMPNGSAIYRAILAKQSKKAGDLAARQKLFRQALGAIQDKLHVNLPDPSASGYTPADSNALVTALTRMPVEGTPQVNSEYTLLSPAGVAAKTIANGVFDIRVEIKNATAKVFVFNANQYAGQSTRVTQRMAFGGLLRGGAGSGDANILQRLHDILKLLEIPALKKLQSQIQNSIDGMADGAGGSKLTLAALALATALNQVLIPTTAVDMALLAAPVGKLLGLAEKIGYGEIAAVEKAAAGIERSYESAISGTSEIRFSPVNPGPLPETVANTFRGGSYTQTTLSEPTTLYRVSGGNAQELGQYWTSIKPSGPLQSQIDLALKPEWGNTATTITTIQVPTGQTIYQGAASSQGGAQLGGGSQIFIPYVDKAWVTK